MTGVSIKIDGLHDTLQKLEAAKDGLADMWPMWDEIGSSIAESTKQRFEEGAGPNGDLWPISWRARKTGGQTLVEEGELRRTIQHNATRNGVEIGSHQVYATIHQFGGTIDHPARDSKLNFKTNKSGTKVKRGFVKESRSNFSQKVKVGAYQQRIPARPFLGLDDDDEWLILAIAERHIMGFFGID